MKHIDGLGELGHIEHAPFTQHMYPDLSGAGAHLFHGLPVRRLQTTLDEAQFETGRTAGFCRELFEVVETGANELQRLQVRDYIRFAIGISINLDKSKCFYLPHSHGFFGGPSRLREERGRPACR